MPQTRSYEVSDNQPQIAPPIVSSLSNSTFSRTMFLNHGRIMMPLLILNLHVSDGRGNTWQS
jgi:hypothetical protein